MADIDQTTRRIVVGVNGSDASKDALRWALAEAELTASLVEVVQAWEIPTSYGGGATVLPGEDLAGRAERELTTTVGQLSAGHPDVAIQGKVLRGHPARVLLEQAKGADLLVVGSHGRGGFSAALLGSVSQYCTQHATCPVVVVRTGR